MTATERLRELLDERGIEYEVKHYDDGIDGITGVWWYGRGGLRYLAINGIGRRKGSLYVNDTNVTPEQAIAATIGETCHTVLMDCFGNKPFNQTGLAGNDTTCGCSECGAPWGKLSIFRGNAMEHNFVACPICGRRVVE